MGQTLEMLLAADPQKVKDIPTGKMEIKRLTKQLGKPFFVTYRAATLDELADCEEKANGNAADLMRWLIYELVTDPDFKNQQLRDHYGVKRPIEIVDAILRGGEITSLYQAIKRLSGVDETGEVVEEAKN